MSTGSIILEAKNAEGDLISGASARILLYHQTLRTADCRFTAPLEGKAIRLLNIPADPFSHYRMVLTVDRRRAKQRFLRIGDGEDLDVTESFLLESSQAKAKFPSMAAIKSEERFQTLARLLANSKSLKYAQLTDLQKAGLLNLHAKASSVVLIDGTTVFGHLEEIREVRPARLFAIVSPSLLDLATQSRRAFAPASGVSHSFPKGWTRIADRGSFKTPDSTANLQLTFAQDNGGDGLFLVDMDLDDNQGIAHAFDVIGHALTGADTHPYNIHQVLTAIHDIDPGYSLS
jgi:hypothetical protein